MTIPSKMDAIIKKELKKGIWLEKVDVPKPPYGWALIKIKRTSICGSDIHIFEWNEWAQRNVKQGMTIGHEFAGEIVQINCDDTMGFKVGDFVTAEGHVVCGKCKNCRIERQHLCPQTKGIGVNLNGIFAQYAIAPVYNLWKCDPSIPLEEYSVFDPFGNAVHSALSFPLAGEDVLVTGAGPIGILTAAVAKKAGAANVVLTNRSNYRLDLAKKVCPEIVTVNTKEKSLEEVMKGLGIEGGFGVGLEMSGSGESLNLMVKNMIMGGNIALLGVFDHGIPVDWNKIIMGALTLKGIYGREMFKSWQQMNALVKSGLKLGQVITHRLHYTDYLKGFELMASKQCGKVILEWD
ncbi:MAG: L-threonine 3-dehydrogenase [Firmicutes bacterium]|nr:L-threonine 3-dehydrogenase [Bacillota bacterium]